MVQHEAKLRTVMMTLACLNSVFNCNKWQFLWCFVISEIAKLKYVVFLTPGTLIKLIWVVRSRMGEMAGCSGFTSRWFSAISAELLRATVGDSPWPPGHVRTPTRLQTPDTLDGLRRQSHLAVRPRHDRAGNSGAPGGDVRHRSLPQPHLSDYRVK